MTRRLSHIAPVVLAIVAVAAPTAQARPENPAFETTKSIAIDLVSPDARDSGAPVVIDRVSPDARDSGRREPAPVVVQAPPVVHADGFDWSDAGLGAAALAALLALAGGTTVLTRRHVIRAS